MRSLEHIGIAVSNLEEAIPLYEQLLNTPCYKKELVESEKVMTAFFQVGNTKIELLQSSDPSGPITKFIDKRGEGLHHLAFAVDDLRSEIKRLTEAGFTLLHGEPRPGADNKWICFLSPRDTTGVLVELCMDRST
jgi:methylmalonyl-CoA/ethylmalonyl-CoA epimerase